MKRLTFLLLIITGIAAFSAAQTAGTAPFRQEGIASWYGREFNGRPTASGEIFNDSLLTAAHPSLPFGTVLTVTNTQNNRQVTVRVNDRGPFVAARIVDLSRAAAEVLDMLTTGTAPVVLELASNSTISPSPAQAASVTPAPAVVASEVPQTVPQPIQADPQPVQAVPQPMQVVPQPPQAAPQPTQVYQPITETPPVAEAPVVIAQPTVTPSVQAQPYPPAPPQPAPAFSAAPPAVIRGSIPPAESAKLYRLQVGSYTVPRNAVDSFDKLKGAGLNPAYERYGEYYRVVLANLRAAEISSVAQILGNTGFREAIIREEN